jgi:hypothetical protein
MGPRVAILLLALLGLTGAAGGAVAEDEVRAPMGSAAALLEALARVPDVPTTRANPVSYLDQVAVAAARPGAAQPGSVAELERLMASDDPAAQLWLAAMRGASSGDLELLRHLDTAAGWPDRLGFDLFDIRQHAFFGAPPSDGSVLLGDFDPEAIATAFEGRDFAASEAGTRTLLCGPAGCEGGQLMDLANADRGLPFGAELGRSEPLAVSKGDLLSSADLATLSAMLEAADGDTPALADDPGYRALVGAADPEVALIQATLLPGGMLGLGPDIYRSFSDSPEEAADLVVALDGMLEPMPAAAVVGILDGATATEQVLTIALAYEDEAHAAIAAEVLPRRLATMPSLLDGPLSELLDERGVTWVSGRVVPAAAGSMASATIELRAPLAGSEASSGGQPPEASSSLYRLFMGMIDRRDLLWLVPVLPLE